MADKSSNGGEELRAALLYKIEYLRSSLLQIESLVGEIKLKNRFEENAAEQIRQNIDKNLNSLSQISVPSK